MRTNYSKAWMEFRKSEKYKQLCDTLKSKGIRQPYSSNIFKEVFESSWNIAVKSLKRESGTNKDWNDI